MTKITPSWYKDPPTSTPKSMNLRLKIGARASWRGLGGSWRVLGGSWGHLGPKMAPRTLNVRVCKQKLRLLGVKLEPQIGQNWLQERSEMWYLFWSIWKSIFGAIWCHLGPILTPKTLPNWGQVGSQIDTSWGVDFGGVFEVILPQVILVFYHDMNDMAEVAKSRQKQQVFRHFWIFGCSVVRMICWLIC